MICKVCGNNVPDGEKICGLCGERMEENDLVSSEAGSGSGAGSDAACSYDPFAPGNEPLNTIVKTGPDEEPPGMNINKTVVLIGALAVAAVALIAGIVVFLLMLHSPASNNDDHIVYTESSVEAGEEVSYTGSAVTESPTAVPAPVFSMANASSIRGTDSEGGVYSVDSILSDDYYTKWVPSKSSGNGIGEWIEISSNNTQYVSGIKILNGYHKNEETWRNNNRVKSCTLSFSNGKSMQVELRDTFDMIYIDLDEMIETDYIRLTIGSIYNGIKWNDTAITYIGAY